MFRQSKLFNLAWSRCRLRYFAQISLSVGLKPPRIDLQSQEMFADQFIIGQAGLGVLAEHVNVLKVRWIELPYRSLFVTAPNDQGCARR